MLNLFGKLYKNRRSQDRDKSTVFINLRINVLDVQLIYKDYTTLCSLAWLRDLCSFCVIPPLSWGFFFVSFLIPFKKERISGKIKLGL